MDKRVEELEKQIEQIQARNRRVEADKAWETSKTRNVFIAVVSFLLVYLVMTLINADNPFFNALISSAAYLFSTTSLGVLKNWWLSRRKTGK